MPSMLRLLCTGDLHLGRRPTRIRGAGRETSVERVWQSIVDYTLDQAVDALVMTGDVVDRENRLYESTGPLQRGLERLAREAIQTFVVSGNHDWNVLPELVEALDVERTHLLGAGGDWTHAPVRADGEIAAHLVGWSYRSARQNRSPVRRSDLESALPETTDRPVLGLLHGDLDRPESPYAPVSSSRLAEAPVDGWLLGHVHAGGLHDLPGSFALYPGSPQPLDPTETGAHGPWLLEVGPEGAVDATKIPLATVRYDQCEVDVGDVENEAEFNGTITSALSSDLEGLEAGVDSLRRVVYRVRCVGRTGDSAALERYAPRAESQLRLQRGRVTATVDSIDIRTRPPLELERLREGRDPPGELARLLVALRDGRDVDDELLREAGDRLDDVYRANAYAPLRRDPDTRGRADEDEENLRRLIRRQGIRLLEQLLGQTGAPDSGSGGG